MTQEEQRLKWRQEYRKYHPIKPARTFYHQGQQRVVTRDRYSMRIFWNKQMTDFLKTHFATSLNEDLAGCLGVSQRTVIRKARELGLKKDKTWLDGIWNERRLMANAEAKRLGYPGTFKKGQHPSPATEFKKGQKRLSKKIEI